MRYTFGYNWNNRTKLSPDGKLGALEDKGREVVHFNPMHVARQRQFYTPSITHDRELLPLMVDLELENPRWAPIMNSGQEQECRDTLASDRGLNEKWLHTLSESMSARKRNTRDKLLLSLGYTYLLSRKSGTVMEDENKECEAQRKEFVQKL